MRLYLATFWNVESLIIQILATPSQLAKRQRKTWSQLVFRCTFSVHSWWVHFLVIKSDLCATTYSALLFYVGRFEEGNISHSTITTFWKTLWSARCRCSKNKGLSNFPLFFNWDREQDATLVASAPKNTFKRSV